MKTFIALSDVKSNGDYTFLEAYAPDATFKEPVYVNGDTWLDILSGYSYMLTDQTTGTWVQIETALDEKINLIRDEIFNTTVRNINNIFAVDRNAIYLNAENYVDHFPYGLPEGWTRQEAFKLLKYESVFSYWQFEAVDSDTFDITALDTVFGSIEDSFKINDTIYIAGSRRNDGFFTITDIDVANNKISVYEELESGQANAFIYLCKVPRGFIQIVANMIYYDLVTRRKFKGLKSERVGTYSWTANDSLDSLGYPADITAGLDSYKSISIQGDSLFVN